MDRGVWTALRRYPVRIARWKSTQKLKAGRRREYPNLVLRLHSAMAGEISDLVGKPMVAYREGGRIVIEVSMGGDGKGEESGVCG